MRIIKAVTVLLMLVLLISPLSAVGSAADTVEVTDELYSVEEFDIGSVIDVLPDELRKQLPDGDLFESESFSEKFSARYFFELIGDTLKAALSPAVKMMSLTLGLVLIASALTALKGLLRNDSLASLFEFISGLCIMLALYSSISDLFALASLYLTQLSSIISAMVPLMLAIGTAGGNLSGSLVSSNAMMLGLAFVEMLAVHGLYPVLQICFGLTAASGIGGGLRLDGISKLVRGVFTWILGFIAAAISAVMSFQNAIAARADSLSMRAVKFAASKAVPVVGGIAGDAVTTVAGSLSLVRTTVGTIGVILIVMLTLPMIVNVLLSQLGVVISQTAADMIGLEREKKLLGEVSGLFGFLAAVCVIAALMFIYALAVFAKTAAALG